MSDMVLIPLPGIGTLELTRQVYEAALRPISGDRPDNSAVTKSGTDLVTAKVLAQTLSLPLSCIYEYAKAERIPCVRVGKHVRFSPARVLEALGAAGGLQGGHA